MVLCALYVCLLHSRFIENHPIDLEMMDPSFLWWFCHIVHMCYLRATKICSNPGDQRCALDGSCQGTNVLENFDYVG
jgi:hypothetical protein